MNDEVFKSRKAISRGMIVIPVSQEEINLFQINTTDMPAIFYQTKSYPIIWFRNIWLFMYILLYMYVGEPLCYYIDAIHCDVIDHQ